MKVFCSSFLLACGLLTSLSAKDSPAAKPLSTLPLTVVEYENVFQEAKKNEQTVVLLFTAPDWCRYCSLLEKKVLSKSAFVKPLRNTFLFSCIDLSHGLEPEIAKKNEELRLEYKVESIPALIVMNADKQIIGKLGYERVSPAQFAKMLQTLRKTASQSSHLAR